MPPAPESMSPRVSMFCTSVSLIRMGIDNLFELITAVLTEYISSEGDSGVDPDLLIKNPPLQHRQRTLPCLHHSFQLIEFAHEHATLFLSSSVWWSVFLLLLWAVSCQMSNHSADKTGPFFHKGRSFFGVHPVDVHGVRIFLFWFEVELPGFSVGCPWFVPVGHCISSFVLCSCDRASHA